MNQCGLAYMGDILISKLVRPAELIMLCDSQRSEVVRFREAACSGDPPPIHNNGANFSFCDGHVKWWTRSRVVVANAGDWWNEVHNFLPWGNADAYYPGR